MPGHVVVIMTPGQTQMCFGALDPDVAEDGLPQRVYQQMVQARKVLAGPHLDAAALARHLAAVVDMAIENACSCGSSGRDGRGYLGHARDCWVHRYRADLKAITDFQHRLEHPPRKEPT